MPRRPKPLGAGENFSIRLPGDLRKQLERAAKANGHSLNNEIRNRLGRSFDKDTGVDRFGGKRNYAFFRLLSLLRPTDPRFSKRHWLDDHNLYIQVSTAIRLVLRALEPTQKGRNPPDSLDPQVYGLVAAARLLKRAKNPGSFQREIEDLAAEPRWRALMPGDWDASDLAETRAEESIHDHLADVLDRAPDDLLSSPIISGEDLDWRVGSGGLLQSLIEGDDNQD